MRRLAAALGAVVVLGACYDFSNDLESCRAAGGCTDVVADSGSGGGAGGAGGGAGGGVGGGAGGGSGGGGGLDGGGSDGGEVDGGFDAGRVTALKACSAGGFCPENPVPTSDHLNGVHGTSATNVWFVGQDGVVVHYDGDTFEVVDAGVSADLRDVWVAPSGEVFIVGDNATYLKGTLGGGFTAATSLVAGNLTAVWGSSSTHVLVGGQNGFSILDDGTGLPLPIGGIDAGNVTALSGNATEAFAVTTAGRLYRRTTGAWIDETPAGGTAVLRDVFVSDAGAVAVGASGIVYTRGGASWTRSDAGSGYAFTSVAATPSGVVYTTQFSGIVALLSNPGQALYDNRSTHLPAAPQSAELYSVWAADETNVFAAGAYGVIAKGNFVESFARAPDATPRNRLNAIWARSASEAWSVGYGGLIRRRVGERWVKEQLQTNPNAHLYAVTGDATRVFAVGQLGAAFERGPNGVWQALPASGVVADFTAAQMMGPRLYVGASNGTILHYPAVDGGWEQEQSGVSVPLRSFAVQNGFLIAAGDARTVIRSDGGTWDTIPEVLNTFGAFGATNVAVSGITVCPDGSLWGSGSNVSYVFNFTAGQFYPAGASHQAIHCSASNTVSAVGQNGVTYRRVGTSGSNPYTQTERSLYGMAPIPGTSSYLVCGEGDTIVRWQ